MALQSHIILNRFTLSTYLTAPTDVDVNDWVSQAEAARIRGVSRQAIAKLIAAGRLPTVRFGGRLFVSKSHVLAFAPLPAGRPRISEGG